MFFFHLTIDEEPYFLTDGKREAPKPRFNKLVLASLATYARLTARVYTRKTRQRCREHDISRVQGRPPPQQLI